MKKGFTLMEMVLVMVIIVILFLLTVPNISNTLKTVNDKGCDAQLKIVDAAILQYILKVDKTPTSIGQLVSENIITQRQTQCQDGTNIGISNGQAVTQ
ncbi:competence protein ComGC [Erysipelothrix larvae]|uniref:Competence protein ComGC n=1 Tax=Erysipelothrix larvae TaxID=1514105 RepID=A0A0X8GZK7_9FIRM|nr:competence type IV pilus major pilin ComGC [Erysipelothrix larvae]AMC93354.1 competence protein ComGC [Erysipelothrix larvae]